MFYLSFCPVRIIVEHINVDCDNCPFNKSSYPKPWSSSISTYTIVFSHTFYGTTYSSTIHITYPYSTINPLCISTYSMRHCRCPIHKRYEIHVNNGEALYRFYECYKKGDIVGIIDELYNALVSGYIDVIRVFEPCYIYSFSTVEEKDKILEHMINFFEKASKYALSGIVKRRARKHLALLKMIIA